MLKVIATGKGGVGKTTTISTLATMFSREGEKVLVFDTDPSMNLAMTLGLPYLEVPTITGNKEEINHELDDFDEGAMEVGRGILENYSRLNPDGIRVVVMGAIPEEGNGCLCSAISIVKILLNYLESDMCPERYGLVIVDSQAGPEILGRGLAKDFDFNMILTEPTPKSAEVSKQVAGLARNLGVENNLLVVNKSEYPEDVARMASLIGVPAEDAVRVRYDHSVIDADRNSLCLLDAYPGCDAVEDIRVIKNRLQKAAERSQCANSRYI